MPNSVTINLGGDRELRDKLSRMTRRMRTSAQRKAVRAGSTPIVQAFRAAAPVGKTKRLRKAQTRKFKTYANTQTSIAVVGADYKIGPHHHLIEAGTAERWRYSMKDKPGMGYTGKGPALGVFRSAFEATKGVAKAALESTLRAEVDAAANG